MSDPGAAAASRPGQSRPVMADSTGPHTFVAFSEISVPATGREALDAAFADRLGAVDRWPGFRGLQVWADPSDSCTLIMVSWWDNEAAFTTYMGSPDHRLSHRRIPDGQHRPRAKAFHRYEVIAQ